MNGMSAESGGLLSGVDHLHQSIRDILTTPLGSRVLRREYGSRLFELVDAPMNGNTISDIYAATIEAISTNEPRFKTQRVSVVDISALGTMDLTIYGEYRGALIELFYPLNLKEAA